MPTTNGNIKVTVQLFYANWCGHCQRFKEEWGKLKKMLEEKGMLWEEYEADKDGGKMDEENIKGFPTIRIISNGSKNEYNGERTANAILLFITTGKNDDNKYKQCGGARQGFTPRSNKNNKYYEMKYMKYKAKYMKLRAKMEI